MLVPAHGSVKLSNPIDVAEVALLAKPIPFGPPSVEGQVRLVSRETVPPGTFVLPLRREHSALLANVVLDVVKAPVIVTHVVKHRLGVLVWQTLKESKVFLLGVDCPSIVLPVHLPVCHE